MSGRDTEALIARLAASATPLRRAPGPLARAALWLAGAALVIAALAALRGARPDLAEQVRQAGFCVAFGACVATGVLAAVAAMLAGLPDRSRLWVLLPLPAAALWLGGIGWGCLAHWVAFDPGAVRAAELLRCAGTLLASALPLSALMWLALRPAARLGRAGPVVCGALAVAALTDAALNLLHVFAATLMVLAWNLGAALLVLAAARLAWRRVSP